MVGDGTAGLHLTVDGRRVEVTDPRGSLLDLLREEAGARSVKDGCSPQGQCGCCTVLVDGTPRVACVTPVRRVAGRTVTTVDGLDAAVRERWAAAFCAAGASQCGFCTPGIIMRLEGLRSRQAEQRAPTHPDPRSGVAPKRGDEQHSLEGLRSRQAEQDRGDEHDLPERSLLAHLCRCTGWRTILDAWDLATAAGEVPEQHRDLRAASRRATIEGGVEQAVAPVVALGMGGFADDTAPPGALVAVPDGRGGWAVGETLAAARAAAGKVQGRRTTTEARPPLEAPPGVWDAVLRTSWVEPAYLELDASWCVPGGEPADPLGNGGAFGGKVGSPVAAAARELADRHGRAVRVLLSREDSVRLGPKRPPVAGGALADGSGVLRVVRTRGVVAAVGSVAPGLRVEEVGVAGPATSLALRASGWAEAVVLLAGARGTLAPVRDPASGGVAEAEIGADGTVRVRVEPGDPIDETVIRSYVTGAAHMALSWVSSEALSVDEHGEVHDLTIRSFGVLRAVDTPPIEVSIEPSGGPPVRVSDAAFAAVAAAAWLHQGCPPAWPTGHAWR